MSNVRPMHRVPWHEQRPIDVDGTPPPNDVAAERRVIDACLAVPGFLARAAPPLEADHMFSEAHRWVFRAIASTGQAGAVDSISVSEWLKAEGRYDQVGGAKALVGPSRLSDVEVREAFAAAHLVTSLYNRRELAWHCQQAVGAIYSGQITDPREFIETFERRTFEICRRSVRGADTTSASDGFQSFLKATLGLNPPDNEPSGFKSYDDAVGEMPMGEYTVIGAATGHGKTAWGLNVAINVALRGSGVMYVSTEMRARDLMMRAACAFAAVPSIAVRRRKLFPDQQGRIIATAKRFAKMPLHIDDNFGQSLASIRSQARRLISSLEREGKRLRLIVVDYVQEIRLPPANRSAASDQPLCELSRGLKDLATSLNVHVIALSQLNDNARMRTAGERRPDMGDLKGAKGIAFPAEVVAFLHREKNKEGKYDAIGPMEVWIRKARFAATEPITLTFDAPLGVFTEVGEL